LERRDPLHAGRSGYRCGRIALNLGLQGAAKSRLSAPGSNRYAALTV
jgi:hypothetical protein